MDSGAIFPFGHNNRLASIVTMTLPFTEIPVIDVAPFLAGDETGRQRVAREIARACEQIGFFYIRNHGVEPRTIDAAADTATRFFALPEAEKRRADMNKAPNHRGYVGRMDGNAGDDRWESFKVGLELPADDPDFQAGIRIYGPNLWPDQPAAFRPAVYGYYLAMLDLAEHVFEMFAVALDLPDGYFRPWLVKPASIMNVNHYPGRATTGDEIPTGVGAHTDYESFAILWQDGAGGLQVRNQAGEWIDARPITGTFVINIGDMMARWSNDRFASTPHRVIHRGERDRLSIAFFGNCNYHLPVACLPTCHSADNPPKYPPTTVGQHLMDSIKRAYSYVGAYGNKGDA